MVRRVIHPIPWIFGTNAKLSEYFLHRAMIANPDVWIQFNNEIFNEALIVIEGCVLSIDKKVPATGRQAINIFAREVQGETNQDIDLQSEQVQMEELKLTDDQKITFLITGKVQDGGGEVVFLDAPGRTGIYMSFLRHFKHWT